MPKDEMQEMQTSETSVSPETAMERFERERLSRRQALKKFGITSAMATFAMFSVDDLAHMVGKAMQQRASDNKVAQAIAKEFQGAGIAIAGNPAVCMGIDQVKMNGYAYYLMQFNTCEDNCPQPTDPTVRVDDPCGCLATYTQHHIDVCNKAKADCITYGCNCRPNYACT